MVAGWHQQQYEHNKSCSAAIDGTLYPDWVVTTLFYAAIHLVDAAFEDELGGKPKDHRARLLWMARVARTKRIHVEYRQLKALSESARYGQAHTKFGPV